MTTTPSGSLNYTHANSNASVDAVKSGAGILGQVTINTKGASSNTLTLYDSLTHGSGTTIAVIDTTSQITTLFFDVAFLTGLSFTMATGTAADVTIAWA